jgi:hypothetical protein
MLAGPSAAVPLVGVAHAVIDACCCFAALQDPALLCHPLVSPTLLPDLMTALGRKDMVLPNRLRWCYCAAALQDPALLCHMLVSRTLMPDLAVLPVLVLLLCCPAGPCAAVPPAGVAHAAA